MYFNLVTQSFKNLLRETRVPGPRFDDLLSSLKFIFKENLIKATLNILNLNICLQKIFFGVIIIR